MGKAQRRKGHRFEREVADFIRKHGFEAVTTRAAAPLEDAAGRDIVTNLPFCIQVKAGTSISLTRALLEAVAARRNGEIPMAIVRDDNFHEKVCVLRLSDLFSLACCTAHTWEGHRA